MGFTPSILCRPIGFLKIIELVLCFICLGLVRHYSFSFGGATHGELADRALFGKIAIGGMILVTFPLLLAHLFGDIGKTMMEVLQNIMGFIVMVAAGALLIHTYHEWSTDSEGVRAALACGSLCIINGVVYAVDAFFAHRYTV